MLPFLNLLCSQLQELDLKTTQGEKSQASQGISGQEKVSSPSVNPSCIARYPHDPIQLCNQLPRITSDRTGDAITHTILSAQNVHGLKS